MFRGDQEVRPRVMIVLFHLPPCSGADVFEAQGVPSLGVCGTFSL